MNIKYTTISLLLLLSTVLPLDLLADDIDYSEHRLFHIERSKNKNIVCYDVNMKGIELDAYEPIKVYWINHEERFGARDDLSAIQKRLAFGYKVRSKNKTAAQIAINAYPDRIIHIKKETQNFKCYTQIDKHEAVLSKIFVKTKDSNSLKVEYIEFFGTSLSTGKSVRERIYNT